MQIHLLCRLFLCLIIFSGAHAQSHYRHASSKKDGAEDIEQVFIHPPESAKPGVLWMWMGSTITKKGITRDLEELKQQGFNRTTMFSVADMCTPWAYEIKNSPTPEIIAFTEPWWELVRHTALESKRLGMDFGMYNAPGYESSGGPWITPELSMQEICWSQKKVFGNQVINLELPKPEVDPQGHTPYPIYNPQTRMFEIPEIPARKTFYKDIAVLALPATGVVQKTQVIDLTNKMQRNGTLNWSAPEGAWIIYRFGHTTSGTLIQPAQWKATGLECDKMNQQAIEFHMDHVIREIKKHLGDLIGTGFTHVHFDSYEAGKPTWTAKMPAEFKQRRGYDIIPYLPVFAGHVIESKKDTAKFIYDFDETIKDLYRDIYFKTIASKLNAAGLRFVCEPYGGPWRQQDVIPMIPSVMTEFWMNKGRYIPIELDATIAALRKSGQNILEAEAFSAQPEDSKWDETPAWIKPVGDAAFCAGVNRLMLSRFVHQPWDDRFLPGATYGQWGTHFDRTQTWWKPGKALIEYWHRCQSLLQWGAIADNIKDDFSANNISIKFIHRRTENTDVYFIANTSRDKVSAVCNFKIKGKQPELWDPVSGERRIISDFRQTEKGISLQVDFAEAQSFFVVFRRKVTNSTGYLKNNSPATKEMIVDGSWQVKFDPAWGGPEKPVTFDSLHDWTKNLHGGIKYYSGTARYKKYIDAPPAALSNKKTVMYLDLGTVKHIARVTLNGKDLGVVWTAPWRIKVPVTFLKSQGNELIIEITNVWANRLIGDEQQPADCEWSPGRMSDFIPGYPSGHFLKEFPEWFLKNQPRPSKGRYCFTTWNYFNKESPLVPSGLLGPVKLVWQK